MAPQRLATQDNDGDCHEGTQNRDGTKVSVGDRAKEDQALRLEHYLPGGDLGLATTQNERRSEWNHSVGSTRARQPFFHVKAFFRSVLKKLK